MIQVDNITNAPSQRSQVLLDDGSILVLDLQFNGATERWVFSVTHPDLTTTNLNVCNFPNLLREWRNIISFGLACQTVSGQDPTNIEDFVNGNAALYVLPEADVLDVEETIFGGVLQ